MRALLAASLLLIAGSLSGSVRASDDNRLPDEVAQALQAADKVELYSLEPWSDPDAKETKWHDYVLLGHTTLKSDKAKAAAEQFEVAIKGWDGMVAACFDPRHGLRVESGGHTYDLLLCYECHQLYIYRDDKFFKGIGAAGSPKVLNKLLSEAKVPLSQSASD